MPSNPQHFLVVIVGPTAVGKTELAIEVAERIEGEIISADSRLFYRGMDIGTAKPSLADRNRVQHHLIDVANPDETWSLAVFQQAVRKKIEDIWVKQKIPMVVGGTGQFIRAIIEEWDIPAQAPNEQLRTILDRWGREIGPIDLHHKVAILDPEAAKIIEPNNQRRSVRALEVMLLTGERFSDQRKKKTSRYDICQIGITRPRDELYRRVDDRIDQMIAGGLLEEVKVLLAKGYNPDLPSLSAIGYREIISVIQGKICLEDAMVLMKRYTRRFIRRQANWFKDSDPTIKWFRADSKIVAEVTSYIENCHAECSLL